MKAMRRISLRLLVVTLLSTVVAACSDRSADAVSGQGAGQAIAISPDFRPGSANALRAILQNNFDQATKGTLNTNNRLAAMPSNNSAGLVCEPRQINPAVPIFQLELPPLSSDRQGSLVVISPDGVLHTIYISYGTDTDPEDLIVSSKSINWESAKERNSFLVDARSFEALGLNKRGFSRLFQKAGIYQFALINGNSRDLLELNGMPFWVIAGCVVHWQP